MIPGIDFWTWTNNPSGPPPVLGDDAALLKRHYFLKDTGRWMVVLLLLGVLLGAL